MNAILSLSNHQARFECFEDASAVWTDLATGRTWRMGPVTWQEDNPIDRGHVWLRTERSVCEQFPGRFRVRAIGDALEAVVLDGLGAEVGTFRFRYALDGPDLVFTLLDVDDALPSLIFPPAFRANSLVVPRGVGQWFRRPLASRHVFRFYSSICMRWFGGLAEDDDAGWIAIWTRGHENEGLSLMQSHASPVHFRSLGQWSAASFPREIRYRMTTGGYVGMAARFREFAIERGLHRSLREKLGENPALETLIGGRELNFYLGESSTRARREDRLEAGAENAVEAAQLQVLINLAHVQRVAQEARELGLVKGLIMLRGWMAGGYDERHPDVWPPDPRFGTLESLRQIVSGGLGYPAGLHDNYADIYAQSPSFPNGVRIDAEGRLKRGGYWAGGQSYLLEPVAGLTYAERNWPQIRSLQPTKMYIDTVTATYLDESFAPGRVLSRTEDYAAKRDVLRFFRDQGVLLASEDGADLAGDLLDSVDTQHLRSVTPEVATIPLWPLVYHDAILSGRHSNTPSDARGTAPWTTTTLLWGYYPMWWVTAGAGWSAGFRDSMFVDAFHARTALDVMTAHRFLTPDLTLEQTEFSSGESVIANFGTEDQAVGRHVVMAGSAVVVSE